MIKKVDNRHLSQLNEKLQENKAIFEEEEKEKDKDSWFYDLAMGRGPSEVYRNIETLEAIIQEIELAGFALIESSEQWVLGKEFNYYL